jgi:hypothetical protein
MTKTYEELTGAAGQARFFRPTRHSALTLFSGAPPRVYFDDQEYTLVDLSGVGIGCAAPNGASPLESINRRGVLRLVQHGREIFRAEARQARFGIVHGKLSAGFALERDFADLDQLCRRNARALAAGIASEPPLPTPSREYKAFCADILEFVGGFLNRIDRHLAPIEARLRDSDVAEIIAELENAAAPRWRELLEIGNAIVLPIHEDKKMRSAFKGYTERTVTRELIAGPGWGRSYWKPLGYPGDFQIMNWIYDGAPQGDSIRAKFLHQLSLVGSKAVKTRMESLADLIVEASAKRSVSDRAFELASIGSGPAREVEPILAKSNPAIRFKSTFVDQEPLALENALGLARRIGGGRLDVQALNISFKEMLNPSPLAASFSDKDVIYSAGLVDYLNPLLAQRFVKRLYQFVRPGGAVIIGNVNNLPTGMIWSSEYAVDWSLFFRSRAEMMAMANETPGAKVSIRSDSLDAIYFLIVEKPMA